MEKQTTSTRPSCAYSCVFRPRKRRAAANVPEEGVASALIACTHTFGYLAEKPENTVAYLRTESFFFAGKGSVSGAMGFPR